MIIREDVQEIEALVMKIITNDNPELTDYEWTIVTQALEVLKESLEDNG